MRGLLRALASATDSGTDNYPSGYQYLNQIIQDGSASGSISSTTMFWYEQAEKVNDPTVTNAAKDYIHNVTQNGWLLDGQAPFDLQVVSDAIAHRVIGDIIRDGIVADIPQLITDDIGLALNEFNVTLGGWGGSFYYWNEDYNGSSVGSQILSTSSGGYQHGEEAKFIAANGAALASSLTNDTYAAVKNATAYIFDQGAELPLSEAIKVQERALDLQRNGGSIAGDPDQIGNFTFIPATNQWVTSSSSFTYDYVAPAIPASGAVADDLNAHRDWILNRLGVTYDNSPDSSKSTKHSDAIINQDQSGYVFAGNDSGMEEGISGQDVAEMPFDSTVYNDYYDSDDNKLATSRYYLANGSSTAQIGGFSLQASEDIVYAQPSQPTEATLILDKGVVNGNAISGLSEQSVNASDSWSSWQVITDAASGPNSSQFQVNNKDGTSFETIWNDPSNVNQPWQWEQEKDDANGNTISSQYHFSQPQQDAFTGFTYQDVTYDTDSSGVTTRKEWSPDDQDVPQLMTASGFDGSISSAHDLWQTRTANLTLPIA